MPARTAADRISAEANIAPPATSGITDSIQKMLGPTESEYVNIPGITPPNDANGFIPTRSGSQFESPSSGNSDEQSKPSSKPFRTPRNAREFASQTNRIATMVLNGEMDLDTARIYGALARTVAQAMTAEVTRARFLKTLPDLSLEDA